MISMLGRVSRRGLGLGLVCAAVVAGGAGFVVLGPEPSSSASAPKVQASIDDWRWAPRDELPAAPKPKEEEPPAAQTEPAEEEPAAEEELPENDPKPTSPATSRSERPDEALNLPDMGSGDDDVLLKAEVLKNGVALPPLEAPPEVRAIFEAGNTIARSPYKWGGGHGKWKDNGYDCSGSVSYALNA